MGLLEAIHDAEIDVFREINVAGTNEILDLIMLAFTFLGISYVIVLVCVPLWFRGKRDSAFDMVVLVILVTIIAEAVKLVVDRPRPGIDLDGVNTIVSATGPAFPSGHATRAFAVATLLFFVDQKRYGPAALAIATLIAISRVYLGVHWPTDILAGAILGSVTAVAFVSFSRGSESYQSLRGRVVDSLRRYRS